MTFPNDLKVGDILLYSSHSLVDDLIKWKETGLVAHIEIYAGSSMSWASRNGVGVGPAPYSFRSEGLVEVRRPVQYFDGLKAEDYFEINLKGKPYGFSDILANLDIKGKTSNNEGVDCSHAAALLLDAAGSPQFAYDYPKNIITPEHYRMVRENFLVFQQV